MRRIVSICAIALSVAVVSVVRAAGEGAAASATGGTEALEQFSKASQALYSKVSGSLIRVRIDQGFQSMLTQAQRREFMEWVRSQPADGATPQPDNTDNPPASTPREQRRAARTEKFADIAGTQPSAAAVPARPMLQLFRRFLEQKLKESQEDVGALNRWRYIQSRLQQPIAEMTGVVIDNEGDAIVLGNWLRDGAPISIRVTAPDGTELNAKYVGGHPMRGVAVIKLESPGAALPMLLADGNTAPGELLMCIGVNSGGIGFIVTPGPSQKRNNAEQRFPIFSNDEHGPTFIVNTRGQLAAIGTDRFALPMSYLKHDIQWIIENKKDVAPRQLGVRYSPVPPALRKSARLLANRPAVIVDDVAAGSPAERAGLQKNDIVLTIDHRPIWQMPQIQWDIATETAPVPIGILRDNKEMTLSMPLD
ncbi:MAG TPA: PDZ domain-containing protein [Phycisphaerae bacterium]|nr:PDZ domain-containing protein [Phycisphaerae bacterium]